jgi:YegS/Rv2252/BmrU family lipid kinase
MSEGYLVIVNPVAGGGRSVRVLNTALQVFRQAGVAFDVATTRYPGHATELASQGSSTFGGIIAVGGDGTLNEVVNGVCRDGHCCKPVGFLPAGRGIDFARTTGIPSDVTEAARRLVRPRSFQIDLGLITYQSGVARKSRYFVNVAGCGFDAAVAERASRYGTGWGGTLPYLTGLLVTIATFENVTMTWRLDGIQGTERLNTLVMANGQYYGGGMRIAPNASIEDGQLDFIFIGDLGKLEFLANVPKVYEGTHLSIPLVSERRGRRIEVDSAVPTMVHADGEVLGTLPIVAEVVPAALTLLI